MSLFNYSTLEQVEKYLTPKFQNISLVSEISLAKSEVMHLEYLYTHLFKTRTTHSEHYINQIWINYPLSSIAITVFVGVYNYDGNYWGHFKERTKCSNDGAWKEYFLQELRKRNLPIIDEFGGQRYVSTILGHAGIPEKSFSGFIEGFVEPALEYGLSASEAIDYLVDNDSNSSDFKVYKLHKNVRDYLTTGGKVVEDFVERCLQVADSELENYPKFTRILPRRVIKSFKRWKENRLEESSIVKKMKITAPVMKLDPIVNGVYVQLPIQRWSKESSTANWVVKKNDNFVSTIHCNYVDLRGSNESELIPHSKKIMISPNNNYEFIFSIDNLPYRRWKFDTHSYLVFDSDSRIEIKRRHIHEGGHWFVIEKAYKPLKEENSRFVITHEPLFEDWQDYFLWEVDTPVNGIISFGQSGDVLEIPIMAAKEKPFLSGGKTKGWGRNKQAFFETPKLSLPLASYPRFRDELAHWKLEVKHTNSNEKVEFELTTLEQHVRLVGSNYEIDMSKLVHKRYIGEYSLKLTGHLGSDISLTFILLPQSLVIDDFIAPLFPIQHRGYQKNRYTIHIDKSLSILCLWPTEVELTLKDYTKETVTYNLLIPNTVSEIKFQFTNKETEESFIVDFLPKAISWAKLGSEGINYKNEIIKINEDALLNDTAENRFLLDLTNISSLAVSEKMIELNILLKDESGKVIQVRSRKYRVGKEHLLTLEPFLDSIKDLNSNKCSIWIELEQYSQPFKVFEIIKKWDVSEISIMSDYNNKQVILSWSESYKVINRVLRIWDNWRPWTTYNEVFIPDNCYKLIIPWNEKENSEYLIEWAVKQQNDFFEFLDKTTYPKPNDNIYKWTFAEGNTSSLSIANIYSGFSNNLVEHTVEDFKKLLIGVTSYGSNFINLQLTHINKWRDLTKEFIQPVKEALTLVEIPTQLQGEIARLTGISEWPIADFVEANKILSTIQVPSTLNKQPVENFGRTSGQMLTIAEKTKEDLHILAQYMASFSLNQTGHDDIPDIIIKYVLKCKNDEIFTIQIVNLINRYYMQLNDFVDYITRNNIIEDEVSRLLELRQEHAEFPQYVQYPYFVSVTALGLRLLSRMALPYSYTRVLRELDMEISSLTGNWLFHDLYFIETYLETATIEQGSVGE
jgi:hypothetical protein